MAKSIPGQLSMFDLMNSEGSPSATSSPVSADGATLSGSQDGQTTALSGRGRARASRSPSPAEASARLIQGTCGLTSIALSPPSGPLSSWVSRLVERLAMVGSTESGLIWKEKTTPAGRVDIPACAVDAPHIRQRLYWVARDMADASSGGWPQGVQQVSPGQAERAGGDRLHHRGAAGDMGDADHQRSQEHRRPDELHQGQEGREVAPRSALDASVDDLADSDSLGRPHERLDGVRRQSVHDADGRSERGDMADADEPCASEEREQRGGQQCGTGCDQEARISGHMADADNAERWSNPERRSHDNNGQDARRQEATGRRQLDRAANGSFWSNAIWLTGADGKARRAEPSIPLLAHGVSGRVGKLRAYGNAIVAPLAAEVIRAFMDVEAKDIRQDASH